MRLDRTIKTLELFPLLVSGQPNLPVSGISPQRVSMFGLSNFPSTSLCTFMLTDEEHGQSVRNLKFSLGSDLFETRVRYRIAPRRLGDWHRDQQSKKS